MSSEELSLTWGDHHSTLVGVFEKLLESSSLVDCTIAAEGQYLKAHKVVLSACSPYFELLFSQENERNPIVILKDIKFQELKAMIDFIYRGRVKIPENRLEDFIDAAESLQIKGLGGGQKADDSNKKGSGAIHKREDRTPLVPRKRRRMSSEVSVSESSPKPDVNNESNSSESLTQQDPTDVLSLSQPEIPSPIITMTTGSDLITPDAPSELSNSETKPSSMPVECTLSSTDTERLLAHAASVVKTEPEPITEIFLDENECFVDPKKEASVEDITMLESDGISAVMEYVQQQQHQSTNQYSGAATTIAAAEDCGILRRSLLGLAPVATLPQTSTSTVRGVTVPPTDGATVTPKKLQAVKRTPPKKKPPFGLKRPSPPSRKPRGPVKGRRGGVSGVSLATNGTPPIMSGTSGSTSWSANSNGLRVVAAGVSGETIPAEQQPASELYVLGMDRDEGLLQRERVGPPKSYPCCACDKSFSSNPALTRHMRTHTGERPFLCVECGKSYTQGHNLRKHMFYAHGNWAHGERDPLEPANT